MIILLFILFVIINIAVIIKLFGLYSQSKLDELQFEIDCNETEKTFDDIDRYLTHQINLCDARLADMEGSEKEINPRRVV
jgi:hypothetical protein